ncbi:MAG: hypothetical protein A3H98_05230 [Bacteroidetes bacterium RIFCSPLOWO2_02_FULL_36_8]|nr:MAG: hypothetical protein A3H98_05230 [Bacteroidetes bacterium RIFCSPLOWO2_02_FULL_36_8]OFY70521.1 MAG: hypothetical protein A3G23_09360 [Bacteroidetes bacterium RIFCSPLOWO2_12_FULL_37_12]
MLKKSENPTLLEKGRQGESVAAVYLQRHGYTIKERNYRISKYEVDILAEKDNTLVFCEVKMRSNIKNGSPEYNVGADKLHKLTRAAMLYLNYFPYAGAVRLDVLAVNPYKDGFEVKHYKDVLY